MNKKDIKRELKEYELDLAEVRAYRKLQNEGFDFGSGYISPNSQKSEDAFFKNEEEILEEMIENVKSLLNKCKDKKVVKRTKNRYKGKKRGEYRLQKLVKNNSYFVYMKKRDGKEYLKRFYLSGIRSRAKKQTNKIIRHSKNDFPLNGNGYRKKYDYWGHIY